MNTASRRRRIVDAAGEGNGVWESIEVGEDLGTLDYVLTEEMVADYRRVVNNPRAAYPTIAGRHPARMFYRKYASVMRVPNMGQDAQYHNPPVPGKRITLKAHVADKYIRRDKTYLVIEASATDEDGRLIEVSRLIGLARPVGQPALEEVARKWSR
jgi:hypothetical protein